MKRDERLSKYDAAFNLVHLTYSKMMEENPVYFMDFIFRLIFENSPDRLMQEAALIAKDFAEGARWIDSTDLDKVVDDYEDASEEVKSNTKD